MPVMKRLQAPPGVSGKKSWKRRRWLILAAAAGLSVLLSALGYGRPYRPVEPLPPGIIDIHCHVAGVGAGGSGCFVSPRLAKSWRFHVYMKSFGVTEKDVLEHGDGIVADRVADLLARSRYVNKAVMLALDGVIGDDGSLDTNRTEVYVPNEFVVAAVARHTNLLFGASINPYRTDALERLVWARQHGAVLVKWIPSIMQIDPADSRLVPFYRKLVELKLPLLTHAGQERSFSAADDHFCDPEKLRLPLSLGVRVIAAHIASTGTYHGERSSDRLARLMKEYSNLCSDISSLTQINKLRYMKEALTRPELSGRLVYGSDFPLINTALVSPWYYCWKLPPWKIASISAVANPWDRDVMIKRALGTPTEVFAGAQRLDIH
jgi:hypothetical protein